MNKLPIDLRRFLSIVSSRWLLYGSLAFTGVAALLFAMRWGPWVGSDSVAYLLSGENWIAGKGLGIYNPSGEFDPMMPPGYPWLIGLMVGLGVKSISAAMGINVVCFALLLLLLGWGTERLSGSWAWGITVAWLTLLSPVVIKHFDGAMSEAPYLILALGNLYALAHYLNEHKLRWLIVAGLLAAGAGLMRTIGLVNLAVGVIILLAVSHHSMSRRLTLAGGYAILAGAWPLAWLFKETLPNRPWASGHDWFVQMNELRKALTQVWVNWLPPLHYLPASYLKTLSLLGITFLAVLGFALALWKEVKRVSSVIPRGGLALWGISALFALGYVAFIVNAYLFSAVQPDINDRTLMPLFPIAVVLVSGGFVLARQAFGFPSRVEWVLVGGAWILGLLFYAPSTWDYLQSRHEFGSGYTALRWRRSEVLQALSNLSQTKPWISNQPISVLFYYRKFPYEISEFGLPRPVEQWKPFGAGDTLEERLFREQCAPLIVFEPELYYQFEAVYGSRAGERLAVFTQGLRPYRTLSDGAIYFHPACP